MRIASTQKERLMRVFAVIFIISAFSLMPFVTPLAQRRSTKNPPKVTGISTRKTAGGEVITLAADGPIDGIQTWQDANGTFNVTLPGAGDSPVRAMPAGVKVRRVGNSLMIEVQAQRGSNVSVHPRFNRLDLVVSGAVEPRRSETEPIYLSPMNSGALSQPSRSARASRTVRPIRETQDAKQTVRVVEPVLNQKQQPETSSATTTKTIVLNPQPSDPVPQNNATTVTPVVPTAITNSQVSKAAPPPDVEADQKPTSNFVKGWWVTALLLLVCVGLLFWRRRTASEGEDAGDVKAETYAMSVSAGGNQSMPEVRERRKNGTRSDRRNGDQGSRAMRGLNSVAREPNERGTPEANLPAGSPGSAALFGAYRVDQEVGKLVLGQAHRMDVLASRAPLDRRAIEASLLKALRSTSTDEHGLNKARQALEEYGFIARQSATLLLGYEACDRAAAARMLAEVGARSSLQFLLEALYDPEVIVRTQVVESIGLLKLPSAIGALLDMARRYPDMPSSVLSDALNACSIDSLDIFGSTPGRPALLPYSGDGPFTGQITALEPTTSIQDLPESTDDEAFVDMMAMVQSDNPDTRATAAQTLSIYKVQRTVSTLKIMAANDIEPAVRAAAVASLGSMDHESVFAPVLVALADEARDVRAAAARALSRLSFDRADAYVRTIETAAADELKAVAQACIKTGMASQALDRLDSDDRRQAYEAFALLSLMAIADETEPILEAIGQYPRVDVRLVAIQVLGVSGQPSIGSKLRQLAIREGLPEVVRTAVLEVVYKLDQMQPV